MMPTLAWLPLALPTDAIAVVAVFLTAAVVTLYVLFADHLYGLPVLPVMLIGY